jgi:BlaI family penicillinase repressor
MEDWRMARELQISDAEWDVMEPIWAADADACTAADVIKHLRQTHDWNHSTVRTLLARLVEKGALDYQVDGSRYIYRAAVSRQQCVRQEARSFLEKAFGGDVAALVAHFIADASLERKEIDELRQLLAQKKNPKEKRT